LARPPQRNPVVALALGLALPSGTGGLDLVALIWDLLPSLGDFLMPVLPFASGADVVQFAKAFLASHLDRFNKDIAICLKADAKKQHAYFPALITCIAFLEFLSGLYAGSLESKQSLKNLKHYVRNFMDASEYTDDRLNVLYELFRHKVAHLALPYAVFDTNTRPNTESLKL
jgi:hypothetical protein